MHVGMQSPRIIVIAKLRLLCQLRNIGISSLDCQKWNIGNIALETVT